MPRADARRRWLALWACLLAVTAAGVGPGAGAARALEVVTLQLKWTHAFQFAGYYAAQEQGYYREAGLDVRFREARPGLDVVEEVVAGRADFGVGTSSLLLARHAGRPVVALAAVFQHSPLVLVARGDAFAQSLGDLAGKRVMIEPQSDELIAMMRANGLDPASLVRVEHSLGPRDMIEGRIDAMSAYSTVEPFYLDHAGVAHRIYSPRAAGIDFYGDTLFTSEARIARHPGQVAAFRAASLRGWAYAMANPGRVIDLILARHAPHLARAFLRYEAAAMADLVDTDAVPPGTMEESRWRHIATTYAGLGLLPAEVSLEGFLYAPPPPERPAAAWTWPPAAGVAALGLALALALTLVLWRRRTR